MISKIGIVYSVALSKRRRVILPSQKDAEIDKVAGLLPGEGICYMPIENYSTVDVRGQAVPSEKVDDYLQQYLGRPPLEDLCAVIENGVVTSVIRADPAIDSLPGKTVILSDTASIGDTYSKGKFTKPPQPDRQPLEIAPWNR